MKATDIELQAFKEWESETQRPWKCFLCYTTKREITIREATEWITSTRKDTIWVIKNTLYDTSTEKIKFEVGLLNNAYS